MDDSGRWPEQHIKAVRSPWTLVLKNLGEVRKKLINKNQADFSGFEASLAFRKSESRRLQLMIVPTGSEYTLPKMHEDMEGK